MSIVCSGGSTPSDEGAGHPDPEIRVGGVVSKKNFFRPFGPQLGLKIRGRPGLLGPSGRALDPPLVCY